MCRRDVILALSSTQCFRDTVLQIWTCKHLQEPYVFESHPDLDAAVRPLANRNQRCIEIRMVQRAVLASPDMRKVTKRLGPVIAATSDSACHYRIASASASAVGMACSSGRLRSLTTSGAPARAYAL